MLISTEYSVTQVSKIGVANQISLLVLLTFGIAYLTWCKHHQSV